MRSNYRLGSYIFACVLVGLAQIGTAAASSRGGRGIYTDDMPTNEPAVQHGNGASGAQNGDEARDLGAAWLAKNQRNDGGWAAGAWGQDEGVQSDVATTAIAVLALRRDAAGSAEHADTIKKGVEFVLVAVETAPREGSRLNTPENTQPQYKLGPLVDTHMAALMLAEVSGQFDKPTNDRINVALDTVIGKVSAAQAENGSFETTGWAPVLSNSIASQGLTRAAAAGRDVDAAVLAKNDEYQRQQVSGGEFDSSAGAGVELYAVASGMRNADGAKARGAPAAAEVEQAATAKVSADDGRLVAGFGSIGGEEMLSYMMISDSLAEEGGKGWTDWQGKIGDYLVSIQNGDGSWSGHHCITSTPFTTAAAVMTLGAGRLSSDAGAAADPEPKPSTWWDTQTVTP